MAILGSVVCGDSRRKVDCVKHAGFGIMPCMAIPYTYWKEPSGFYLGYMNDYPDNWTQGKTLDELERMLVSLRRDIETDPDLCAGRRNQGVLQFA